MMTVVPCVEETGINWDLRKKRREGYSIGCSDQPLVLHTFCVVLGDLTTRKV
jgi:hypothetical protein